MDNDYYLSRKRKLLREFDKTLGGIRGLFVSRYGEESVGMMLKEARQEYEELITQLPYIGGKQPLTRFVIFTAWTLTLYRVLQRRGRTVEEVGLLVYQAGEAILQAYPAFLRRAVGHMTFSQRYLRRLSWLPTSALWIFSTATGWAGA